MLDAKSILDQFLGSGGGSNRGMGDILKRMGGPAAPGGKGSAGGSGDLMKQVEGLAKGNLGGVAGGAIAGTLASVLLGGKGSKKGPALGGSAMKLGGLAILGGLAYKAWQNYQANQAPAPGAPYPYPQAPGHQTQPQSAPIEVLPPPTETPFSPSTSADEQKLGLLLIRAMIAAACADGRIDREEIGKIKEALKAAGAEANEEEFLLEHLGQADDLDAIAAEARGPELGSEVWLAARLAIDPDTPAEQYFLQALAAKLKLDEAHVAHLEATAAQAKASGVTAG